MAADEVARKDDNSVNTQIGVTEDNQIRKIKTTDKGVLRTDIGAKIIGGDEKSISVTDLSDRELQEAQLVELRLISIKLDCLQPDDEELDANDLEQIDE